MTKIAQQLKRFFSSRGKSFSDEVLSALISRASRENPFIDANALAAGAPSEQNALLAAMAAPAEEVPFLRTATVSKGVGSTGSVVISGLPVEGQLITIADGNNAAVVFEFDSGDKAAGTLTLSGQPADTNTFTLDDGTTSKVLEFDSGVAGVASTGAVITLGSVPVSGSVLTLKSPSGVSFLYEFQASPDLVAAGHKWVCNAVGSATVAGKELMGAINGTGPYIGNGSFEHFTASSGGAGVVNIVRKDTGAGNETISSGALQVETATAVGTITTSGNATVVVAGVGIAGTPLSTSVAVVAGTLQVETATVVGTIGGSGAGNATVVVTAAGMTNSPKTVSVAVANNDTASQVAGKIRTALGLDADVSAFFTVGGATTAVILTAKVKAANDGTMNISTDNGTCSGLTAAPTSANTTAGVTPDTAALWAAKVRSALGGVSAITSLYTVGGSSTAITLTALTKAANDASLNISLANGTCVGITAAPFSVDTTAGVASVGTVTSSFSGGVTAIAAGSNITAGHVGVAIGVDTATSVTNLIAAINGVTAFLFTAAQGAGLTAVLTAKSVGTGGNAYSMAKSGANLAVSAGTFSGGHAAGSGSVGGGHVAVAIGATAALTATALHNAINAATSDITSTNSPAGTCALANTTANGALGNILITENATNVVVTGMSAGVSSSASLIDDEEVGVGRAVFVSNMIATVDGATAWADAATLTVEDTDGNDFLAIARAALTGNAVVFPSSANVTRGNAFKLGTGGTEGKGLRLVTDANEETGSDVVVTVSGMIKGV